MAKCVKCGTKFVGKEENKWACPECGTEPTYTCPDCKNEIKKTKTLLCKKCGYFKCSVCKKCFCNSMDMGWNGSKIYYQIDAKDKTIAHIGYRYAGTHKSYVRLHSDISSGNKTIKEILEFIIQTARNQKTLDSFKLCPRMIAYGNIFGKMPDAINQMMNNINFETQGASTTQYNELIGEIRKAIIQFEKDEKDTFTTNVIIGALPNSRRRELDKDHSATRRQIETAICQGIIKKVIQGGVTQESVYEIHDGSICEFWKEVDGIKKCQCPSDLFEKYIFRNGRYIKAEGETDA